MRVTLILVGFLGVACATYTASTGLLIASTLVAGAGTLLKPLPVEQRQSRADERELVNDLAHPEQDGVEWASGDYVAGRIDVEEMERRIERSLRSNDS